ncbi:YitT family protein [Ancylomarina sp. 16SWW S1-10-2]|uniref:YitT family protein n=1 Tax=Ancylomarina sp. 16SWW S1-10-2 TaxID=2499681 RepID=UPI0012AE90D9|nr:YitT family protein [Ancylomarina sp. 16SWW S1-10-2]MRT92870.1 YitT family protein [Ancylomarina sp. 16SWW S1-10-2]
MAFIQNDKLFSGKWFYNYALLVAGSLVLSLGFIFFITPHFIVPGGAYGIGIIVNKLTIGLFPHGPFNLLDASEYSNFFSKIGYYFMSYQNDMFQQYDGGIPVGLTGLVVNVSLVLIGIKILGPRFGFKTFFGFFFSSIFIDLATKWWGIVPLVDDVLLSCVFGGIIIGFGFGLILKARATTTGTDTIGMILSKYTSLPLGQMIIYVDLMIILCSLYVDMDWQIPLYSLITLYISGRVIDITIQGSTFEKALFIISDKTEEIRDKVVIDMKRGGTYLKGQGMYDGQDKNMIFIVVNRRELSILKDFIEQIDPKAFITVMETNEILGKGFKSLSDKVE